MIAPDAIDGFAVVEFGFFAAPILPKGYVPPPNGQPPLEPVQNLAVCTATGVDGFYLLYCTPEWKRVTYSYHGTIDATKRDPVIEFGQQVTQWNAA